MVKRKAEQQTDLSEEGINDDSDVVIIDEVSQPNDKRRRCENDEVSQPSEKRRKCENSAKEEKENNNRYRTSKQWSVDINKKDVTVELLEDMGVNILDDSSRDSLPPPRPQTEINLVLQKHDTNVMRRSGVGQAGPDGDNGESEGESLIESFNSQGSFDCSVSFTAPERADSLSNHAYARASSSCPVDQTVPDEFYKYNKKKHPCKRDVFNTMSDEVVLQFFRWLPKSTLARCGVVCKRWRRLSLDESLWKRLDLGLKTLPPGVVGQVIARGCNLLRLARATIKPNIFQNPASGVPTFSLDQTSKLTHLDLSMASIQVACLENLLKTCRTLKKLALENCLVSDEVCTGIGLNSNLSVLHLGMTQGLTPLGVQIVLDGCTNLTELNVGWTGLSELGVRAVCEHVKPSLERLNISGNRDSLQDDHTFQVVTNAPNLRELDLSDATKITSVSLDLVVEHLKQIESLSTSRCYGISPSSYLILSSCPSLLYLNVFGLLRDPAMMELRSRLQGIEINKFLFTSISRPTVGIKRTSIWNLRVRE